MLQQVNLYRPLLRDEPKLFAATTIAAAVGIVAAGLLAMAAYSWWRLARLERQVHAAESQQAAQQQLIAHANAVVEQGEGAQSVEARIRTTAMELARRQQILRTLQGAGGQSLLSRPSHGFAGRMAALAREQLDGLWLTGAVFTADDGGFALTGEALQPELVPVYLQRLAGEAALAGTQLQTIEIRPPKSPTRGQVAFSLSSTTSLSATAALSSTMGGTP
jgi:hypothetical protein